MRVNHLSNEYGLHDHALRTVGDGTLEFLVGSGGTHLTIHIDCYEIDAQLGGWLALAFSNSTNGRFAGCGGGHPLAHEFDDQK